MILALLRPPPRRPPPLLLLLLSCHVAAQAEALAPRTARPATGCPGAPSALARGVVELGGDLPVERALLSAELQPEATAHVGKIMRLHGIR
eukprot:SAG31_NODE_28280_length_412_cov_1.105431_1_plen_90_part_10